MMKECKTCNITKPLDEFYSQKLKTKSKGEYIYYALECKTCRKLRTKLWKVDNPDLYRDTYKKYNSTFEAKEIRIKYNKKIRENGQRNQWLSENKEKLSAYGKKRRQKNHKVTQREWDDCRQYFNFRCAYCGKTWEDNKKETKKDLHKEHVDDQGTNDLSNCIPSCTSCNSRKWKFDFDEWYNKNNPIYSYEAHEKIRMWITYDYKKYIEISP